MTPTPHFLLDLDEVRRRYDSFQQAFPTASIFYALKANPEPTVCRTLASLGCGFEAASWPEIEQLLHLGVEPDRIVYGTAVKPADHLVRAVEAGVTRFAADADEELELLARCAPASRVFIRARVDDSSSVFQMSGKFGTPLDSVVRLVGRANELGLIPWGLSFNVGSQATRVDSWTRGVEALAPLIGELLAERNIKLEVLNLGGGFPAVYRNHPDAPELEEIAASVHHAVDQLPYQPQLLLEPGRGLVATAMSLVTSVIARIERHDGPWLYLDAGIYNALFEAMVFQGGTRYPVSVLDDDVTPPSPRVRPFVLAGPTGDGIDVIDRGVELPDGTAVGSRLRFDHVGAYTTAMASAFNGFPAPTTYHVLTEPPIAEAGQSGDTHASRLAIGFPDDPTDWCRAPASFGEGELRILGHPVMEDWEQAYMEALASVATSRGGTVLELGYGLGLSAAAIQAAPNLARHVVVECHPDVVSRCLDEWREAIASQRMQVLVGLWQEVTPQLADGTFDGICFDTYPLVPEEIHRNHFEFFAEAFRLLKPGGVLTYYSDEAESLSEEHVSRLLTAGFRLEDISGAPFGVQPPNDCEYWQARTLVVPVVKRAPLPVGSVDAI